MARAHLTARNVPTLEALDDRGTEWFDDALPGFYLRVSPPSDRYPKGVRAYGLLYRVRGRQFRMNLGRHPVVGLADARERAREVLAAAQLRGENLGRDRRAVDLAGLMELWINATAARKAPATVVEQRRIIAAYVRPSRAGGLPLPHLRRADLQELVEQRAKTSPVQALAIRRTVRTALRWAIAEEMIDRDPSAAWAKPARETTRERVLRDDELAQAWRTFQGIRGARAGDRLEQAARVAQLVLLLAQRPGETGLMRWQDVDARGAVWHIPGRFRKGGRSHVVPLSVVALHVLAELFPHTGAGERVFPDVQAHTDRHWIDDVRELAKVHELLEHWTPHDLRRTAATGLAKDGTPREIIAMIVGHVVQAGGAVTGTYDRFDRMPERAGALQRWADRVGRIVRG